MRVQTLFGKLSAGTNERLFGSAIFLLRLTFGVIMLLNGRFTLMAAAGKTLPPGALFAPFAGLVGGAGTLASVFGVLLLLIGIAYLLGIFTRPAGILLIAVIVIADIFVIPFSTVKLLFVHECFVVSIALMGIAGGLGHAGGLNGLILRHIPRPGMLVRTLFS